MMVPYIFIFIRNTIILFVVGIYDEFCYKCFGNRLPLSKEQEQDIEGEVVVITGANRGIGKQLALEMAKRKAIVVFGCRNMKIGEEAVKDIQKESGNHNLDLVHLDLMDMDSVEQFAKTVSCKYPRIKILINNAGITLMESNDVNVATKDGFNPVVAANYLGHFLLTNLLLKNLRNGSNNGPSRIVALSSSTQIGSILDTNDLMMKKSGFGIFGELPYANTKHANSLFVKELAKRMKGETWNIYSYSVCPMLVRTEIYNNLVGILKLGFRSCELLVGLSVFQAVTEYLVPVCLSKEIGENETGLMFRHRKPWDRINHKLSEENKLSEDLWNTSVTLVKLDERLSRPTN